MTIIRDFDKHLTQIFSTWEGMDITLRHFTISMDDMGRPIERSYVDSSIIGTISHLPQKSELRGAGWINETNMIGFFQTTTIEEHDHIIHDGNTYEVIKIHGTIYDVDTLVAQTVELAKVST